MFGSTNVTKFKKFQVRWKEKLGYKDSPYLIRWTFIFFGYSLRIHHWLKSDDNRFFHDHSSDLLSTNRHSFEKKIKNKNNKNISVFNGTYTNINTIESKKSGIKRIKRVKSNTIYNLNIIDDSYANKYLERTNTKSRPKANKYVKNLYVISNEIVDKFHKKISED